MPFLKKLKDVGGNLAEGTKRGAQRGKLELEVRRVEGKIDDEKKALGSALYPLLVEGSLAMDNPEVAASLVRIATLSDDLAAKRKEIESLGDDDVPDAKPHEPASTEAAG